MTKWQIKKTTVNHFVRTFTVYQNKYDQVLHASDMIATVQQKMNWQKTEGICWTIFQKDNAWETRWQLNKQNNWCLRYLQYRSLNFNEA